MKKYLPLILSLLSAGACDEGVPDEDTDALQLAVDGGTEGGDGAIWRPKTGATWDWQLTTPVDIRANVDIYDVDGFTATAAVIARLHAQGRKVVCYINVGAWEDWRPDAKDFPPEILGKAWSATKFTDEKWLDIRRIDLLSPILGARFDMAKSKGCDAIEPDNIDGYDDSGSGEADRTGFELTAEDQLRFNRYLACEAHQRGMAIGLKNDTGQAAQLSADFDFVVSEQCFDYNECKKFTPFLRQNKAVLVAEYREDLGDAAETKFDGFCKQAEPLGISAILKNNALDRWRRGCAHDEPEEAKPEEAKPAEAKPAEAQPAETKPAEAKPGSARRRRATP